MTRAEFARHIQRNRSYITQLAKAGRLVLDADGNVLVAESLARIETTADKSKAATVQRHSKARGETTPNNEPVNENADNDGLSYSDWHRRRERANALKAEQELAVSNGQLLLVTDIEPVIYSSMTLIRSRLESLGTTLALQLAAESDANRIQIMIDQYVEQTLANLHKTFKDLARKSK